MNESAPLASPSEGEAYDQYLASFEGRLRVDLAWLNLLDHLDQSTSLVALDAGAGTGAMALRLAEQAEEVHLLDPSEAMLQRARAQAKQRQLLDRLRFHVGRIEQNELAPESFDLIVCHHVIEYLDHQREAVRQICALLRPGGLISLLVRNRYGETMRAALGSGDLDQVRKRLEASSFSENLFGLSGRLLTGAQLEAWLKKFGIRIIKRYGVRVVADYLPDALKSEDDAYSRILELERALGGRQPYRDVARYVQIIGAKKETA